MSAALLSDVAEYDLRGLNCPLPVLKTQKRLKSMASGERLWVRTTDPLAVIDIPNFCREKGHALLATEATEDGHRFLIARGA
ncbi:sulfurtransferase TusA family protein [Roseitalea sp. MMSF_3546]|uniref:sulfurtransferase TusA family protein n=1 Tax=Roseitalea sp. MMSF_3546 TaxID=3046724 RepID=UPI00273DBAC9|nr:sulfurtransferase TusA family protein [Roseitalea sp. MMSF_3546]